ncbi:HIT family protein [Patescibacteria group bacterium]|nr:HIT family protein [Patescibacteria group bacterium]
MSTVPEPSIFTKIINREIPANIVYEDDIVIAFLTIEPVNVGHTLIVPKKPFVNLLDGDEDVLGHMVAVAKKVGTALIANSYATGINLIMNNGSDADQEVFHAHMHVVPRKKDDGSFTKPTHVKPTPEETTAVVQNLKSTLG